MTRQFKHDHLSILRLRPKLYIRTTGVQVTICSAETLESTNTGKSVLGLGKFLKAFLGTLHCACALHKLLKYICENLINV